MPKTKMEKRPYELYEGTRAFLDLLDEQFSKGQQFDAREIPDLKFEKRNGKTYIIPFWPCKRKQKLK